MCCKRRNWIWACCRPFRQLRHNCFLVILTVEEAFSSSCRKEKHTCISWLIQKVIVWQHLSEFDMDADDSNTLLKFCTCWGCQCKRGTIQGFGQSSGGTVSILRTAVCGNMFLLFIHSCMYLRAMHKQHPAVSSFLCSCCLLKLSWQHHATLHVSGQVQTSEGGCSTLLWDFFSNK